MIGSGLLKAPDVDAALMIHVMAGMPFEAGTVIYFMIDHAKCLYLILLI